MKASTNANTAIGTHHLEYGFPSTHSTNSVSIALYLFSHVHRLSTSTTEPFISDSTFYTLSALLAFYTFSIVYGRLYTAMHSFTDCAVGILLGALIWFVFDGWLGLGGQSWIERWLVVSGWQGESRVGSIFSGAKRLSAVPATLIPLCLLVVHKHPQPVDDCPCFEDAIAFISVVLGSLIARWATIGLQFASESRGMMPGGAWSTWEEETLWWALAAAKMFFGRFPAALTGTRTNGNEQVF